MQPSHPHGGATTPAEDDELVPALFTWNFGGQKVEVVGGWDGWTRKTPLTRRGADHAAVLLVPRGAQEFKYYVDGNWQCNPALATSTDEHGNTNNSVTIEPLPPSFDGFLPEPSSPVDTYDCKPPVDEHDANDVPVLPRYLGCDSQGRAPRHVRLERAFIASDGNETRTVQMQQRYREKLITTVFVTTIDSDNR